MYDFGDIVLIPFPFTDLTYSKLRPALIVSAKNRSEDMIVAFIGSGVSKNPFHLPIRQKDDCFSESGLKVDSFVLLNKLATLNKRLAVGKLGQLPKAFLKKNKDLFYEVFGF